MVSLLIAWQRQAICHVVRFASGWEPSGRVCLIEQSHQSTNGKQNRLLLELGEWCLVLGDEGTIGAVAGNGDAACSNLELGGQFVELDDRFWWTGQRGLPGCPSNATTKLTGVVEQRVTHRAAARTQ